MYMCIYTLHLLASIIYHHMYTCTTSWVACLYHLSSHVHLHHLMGCLPLSSIITCTPAPPHGLLASIIYHHMYTCTTSWVACLYHLSSHVHLHHLMGCLPLSSIITCTPAPPHGLLASIIYHHTYTCTTSWVAYHHAIHTVHVHSSNTNIDVEMRT